MAHSASGVQNFSFAGTVKVHDFAYLRFALCAMQKSKIEK